MPGVFQSIREWCRRAWMPTLDSNEMGERDDSHLVRRMVVWVARATWRSYRRRPAPVAQLSYESTSVCYVLNVEKTTMRARLLVAFVV